MGQVQLMITHLFLSYTTFLGLAQFWFRHFKLISFVTAARRSARPTKMVARQKYENSFHYKKICLKQLYEKYYLCFLFQPPFQIPELYFCRVKSHLEMNPNGNPSQLYSSFLSHFLRLNPNRSSGDNEEEQEKLLILLIKFLQYLQLQRRMDMIVNATSQPAEAKKAFCAYSNDKENYSKPTVDSSNISFISFLKWYGDLKTAQMGYSLYNLV